MGNTDAIIVCGEIPHGISGTEMRDHVRLTIDGMQASLGLLHHYFSSGRDARVARERYLGEPRPFVSINGPYLSQFLEARGLVTETIPQFTPGKKRLMELLAEKPRAVVVSTTFLTLASETDAIAAFVKAHSPDTTVVAGGIKIWKSYRELALLEGGAITGDIREAMCRDSYLLDPGRPSPVDVLIVSERGEHTLAGVLHCLRDGADWRKLDNVAYWKEGSWRINRVRPEAPSEVRVDWGRWPVAAEGAYVPVQAGTGCRYRCAFCDFPGLRRFGMRTTESIIEELRTVPVNGGVRRVHFVDDNLFASRGRTLELCRSIIDSRLSLAWRGHMRVDIVDREVTEHLAESGCSEAMLGVESGDREMLMRMQKRFGPDSILHGVRMLDEHGIGTLSSFICGFPGETDDSIKNTVDLLNAYPTDGPGLHRFIVYLFAVLPLTRVASPESRDRYDLRGHMNIWSHLTMTAEEAAKAVVRVYDSVGLEPSPVYLEIGELPGLSRDQRRRVYALRTRTRRTQRGLLPGEDEAALWEELEELILPAQAVVAAPAGSAVAG